jgi:hypothetical protein
LRYPSTPTALQLHCPSFIGDSLGKHKEELFERNKRQPDRHRSVLSLSTFLPSFDLFLLFLSLLFFLPFPYRKHSTQSTSIDLPLVTRDKNEKNDRMNSSLFTPPSNAGSASASASPTPTASTRHRRVSNKWTPEEDERLRIAVAQYCGREWSKIAKAVGTKAKTACYQHWFRVLHPSITKSRFSDTEYCLLALRVKMYGDKAWCKVAEGMPGRTDTQCRARWMDVVRGSSALMILLKDMVSSPEMSVETMRSAVAKCGVSSDALLFLDQQHHYLYHAHHPHASSHHNTNSHSNTVAGEDDVHDDLLHESQEASVAVNTFVVNPCLRTAWRGEIAATCVETIKRQLPPSAFLNNPLLSSSPSTSSSSTTTNSTTASTASSPSSASSVSGGSGDVPRVKNAVRQESTTTTTTSSSSCSMNGPVDLWTPVFDFDCMDYDPHHAHHKCPDSSCECDVFSSSSSSSSSVCVSSVSSPTFMSSHPHEASGLTSAPMMPRVHSFSLLSHSTLTMSTSKSMLDLHDNMSLMPFATVPPVLDFDVDLVFSL